MNEVPTLIGEKIILRQVKGSDIDDRSAIGRQNEYVHMCGGDTLAKAEYPDREFWENWYNTCLNDEFMWIIEAGGHCIGAAGFHNISDADKSATYRIGIFDVNRHSQGIGTEVTNMLLSFGFDRMKWHRIELRVLDYNFRAIRCYEKCGFVREGVLRENAYIDGRFYSDIVMSILDYEYERRVCTHE